MIAVSDQVSFSERDICREHNTSCSSFQNTTTDFIYTVFAEEWEFFFGSIIFFLLFIMFIQ